MAKNLIVRVGGQSFNIQPTKVERRKLYGWNELEVDTPQGLHCTQVGLNSDGVTIIPAGGTKTGMLCADGQWMERAELVAVGQNGKQVEKVSSSFDDGIELTEKCSVDELLDHNISSIYQLTGDESLILASRIGQDIYRCTFNYLSSYEPSPAFVLANGADVFILSSTPGDYEYVGLEEHGMIDAVEEEIMDEDELDFNF